MSESGFFVVGNPKEAITNSLERLYYRVECDFNEVKKLIEMNKSFRYMKCPTFEHAILVRGSGFTMQQSLTTLEQNKEMHEASSVSIRMNKKELRRQMQNVLLQLCEGKSKEETKAKLEQVQKAAKNQVILSVYRQIWVMLDIHQMKVFSGSCHFAGNERVTWEDAIYQICLRYIGNIIPDHLQSDVIFTICISDSMKDAHLEHESKMLQLLQTSVSGNFKLKTATSMNTSEITTMVHMRRQFVLSEYKNVKLRWQFYDSTTPLLEISRKYLVSRYTRYLLLRKNKKISALAVKPVDNCDPSYRTFREAIYTNEPGSTNQYYSDTDDDTISTRNNKYEQPEHYIKGGASSLIENFFVPFLDKIKHADSSKRKQQIYEAREWKIEIVHAKNFVTGIVSIITTSGERQVQMSKINADSKNTSIAARVDNESYILHDCIQVINKTIKEHTKESNLLIVIDQLSILPLALEDLAEHWKNLVLQMSDIDNHLNNNSKYIKHSEIFNWIRLNSSLQNLKSYKFQQSRAFEHSPENSILPTNID